MLSPPFEPPYRVVLRNDEEATVLAGDVILGEFSGGWDKPIGHSNALFFAKAAGSYETLVHAVEAARNFVAGTASSELTSEMIISQLENALQMAAAEPQITPWSEVDARRTELRAVLADFLGKPISEMPPISREQDKLLGELEFIDSLISPTETVKERTGTASPRTPI